MEDNISDAYTLGFPFKVNPDGRIHISGGDESLYGKIIQILFTSPGERVHQPAFGCGLFNVVFEPNDSILKNTLGFYIREALLRWMDRDIIVENVAVDTIDEEVHVCIDYRKKVDLVAKSVRLHFR